MPNLNTIFLVKIHIIKPSHYGKKETLTVRILPATACLLLSSMLWEINTRQSWHMRCTALQIFTCRQSLPDMTHMEAGHRTGRRASKSVR